MILTVLGSGTFQPTADRGCPGYLLQLGNYNVVIDPGSGSLRQLARLAVQAPDINCIILSHLHIDHTGDLLSILFSRKNLKNENPANLTIIGPSGFADFFNNLSAVLPVSLTTGRYETEVTEFAKISTLTGNDVISALEMNHAPGSVGIRIEYQGKVFAYTGDTDYSVNTVELCRDADLALIECTAPEDNPLPGHLTPSGAGRIAEESGAKKVILTHFGLENDPNICLIKIRKYYTGEVSIAKELNPVNI